MYLINFDQPSGMNSQCIHALNIEHTTLHSSTQGHKCLETLPFLVVLNPQCQLPSQPKLPSTHKLLPKSHMAYPGQLFNAPLNCSSVTLPSPLFSYNSWSQTNQLLLAYYQLFSDHISSPLPIFLASVPLCLVGSPAVVATWQHQKMSPFPPLRVVDAPNSYVFHVVPSQQLLSVELSPFCRSLMATPTNSSPQPLPIT